MPAPERAQRPILTVTLNPALDLTTAVPRLEPQHKLRCSAPRYDPGGGGVNVSRVIAELEGQSVAFVASGGATGAMLAGMLAAAGVRGVYHPVSGETRTSFTVMEEETGLHYRFVLPGPAQDETAAEALLAGIVAALPGESAYVVLSGSLLPGLPPDFYGQVTRAVQARGAAVILDAHGNDLRFALDARPHIIRVNHIEAAELSGIANPEASAHVLSQTLIAQQRAEIVLVSLEEHGTLVTMPQTQFEVHPPPVAVRSMVGAGDSFVGALTLWLARGAALPEAVRRGVAAAAAAVTTEGTQLCQSERVDELFDATWIKAGTPGDDLVFGRPAAGSG